MSPLVVHCKHAQYDVFVARPGKWGNPFVIGRDGTRTIVIAKYHSHLLKSPSLIAALPELRGKRLACYCAPEDCHGDLLAAYANGGALEAFCDASIEGGNPGGHGVGGYLVVDDHGDHKPVVLQGAYNFGSYPELTNNACEYGAVIACLRALNTAGWGWRPVILRSDSQLVINQLSGIYDCSEKMARLRQMALNAAKAFPSVKYEWIPREANTEADALSRSLY